jgi:hypothetical protein
MARPSRSPNVVKGSLVRLIPDRKMRIEHRFVFQYNPEVLDRRFHRSTAAKAEGEQHLRFRLFLDATEALGGSRPDPKVIARGIAPQLESLETLFALDRGNRPSFFNNLTRRTGGTARSRTSPVTLFCWGKERVMPVNFVRMNVTEEAFDPELNPLRARVDLQLRVLPMDGKLEAKIADFLNSPGVAGTG